MEDFDWNKLLILLFMNFLITSIVPLLIKKPTGVQVIDDFVLYLNSQKGFFLSSTILLTLGAYLTHLWLHNEGHVGVSTPDF